MSRCESSTGTADEAARPAAARSTARLTTFSSSRTFPGQSPGPQPRAHRLGQAHRAEAEATAREVREVRREQRDVLAPLAQRRHVQREHGQAVVEVGAEATALDLAGEVAVGGGDHPHVDVVRAVGADALDLAALQRAQQLGLQRQRQLADLVEEQRAPVGHLELARPVAQRAGEGARHVAEQLALGDRLRQRRAVDVDQRLFAPRRQGVHVLRDQLLADAGLAGDEHRQVGGGDHLDLLEQPRHRGARAEDLARALGRVPLQLARHLAAVLGPLLQRLDQRRRAQGRARERTERRQEALVQGVEGVGLERVGRQRADHLAALGQRAAEAGVDVRESVRVAGDQAVEGIDQRAVRRKAHRLSRPQDDVEPRVLAAIVAPREGRRHQAVCGDRHQLAPVEAQQAGGVAGNGAADRGQQPRVAVRGRERGRQIASDLEQRAERLDPLPGLWLLLLSLRQRCCLLHNGQVVVASITASLSR